MKSDALVFFRATGDLAYKKIFPSLQAMVRRGKLDVPIVGIAKAGWTLEQLRARAKESVELHGGLDSESIRDERIKVLQAIETIENKDVVRGQFKGYLSEAGVEPGSKTETFAALKMGMGST